MKTQAQNERDRKTILERVWDEVKKINWQEINKETSKTFTIGLVGNPAELDKMIEWLSSINYKLAIENDARVKEDQEQFKRNLKEHVVKFDISKKTNEKDLKNLSFCITTENGIEIANKSGIDYYLFTDKNDGLDRKILDNNEKIAFALSYNFPVFRSKFSNISIQNTSAQNASWTIATASPNLIPGPHQVVTAPIEAISDFTVLTANQTKMLFELLGLSGHKINPVFCLMEFGIVLFFANMAQSVATSTVGKVPAGAGLIVKGTVAYAFTTAIGEALFFYITTGEKVGKDFIEKRFKKAYETSKAYVENLVKKKESETVTNKNKTA